MFKYRFLAIGVLALLAVSMAVSNLYSRRSSTSVIEANDFYQRHPDWTDNQQKAVIPVTGEQAFPDYYQRHPELIAPAGESVDTSDYYFRHPELSRTSASNVDLTDYYFRHMNNRSLP